MTPDQITQMATLAGARPGFDNHADMAFLQDFAALVADAAAAPLHARIAELEAENKQLRILASGGIDLFERYSTFKAKCEELEAMLDAIGAGGVGQNIKPQVQADTAQKPVAWIDVKPNPFDPSCRGAASVQDHALPPGEHKLYAAPQPAENLRCKSTQKRLATLWGYEKPQHRQPLTNEQIIAIADNARAAESGDAGYILPIAFARAIEAAHGIIGGSTMTKDQILELAREADVIDFRDADSDPHVAQMVEFLKRFAELVATAERRKHQADIERWKTEAATAEKWRGLALSKEGDGRTVQRIQQEAAAFEREACADILDRNCDKCDPHSIAYEVLDSNAKAIRARGQQ